MIFMHSYTYRGQPLARAAQKCAELGGLDHFRILNALKRASYQGDCCIECWGRGDPSVPAERNIAYLRRLPNEVQAS